jgi:ABC-type glycerol-3-phosphate transport system permease component
MKRKSAVRDTRQLRITKVIVFIIFVFYAASLIFPFLWMAFNMFKTNKEFFQNVWSWPANINNGWKNIQTAMTMKKGSSTIVTMTLRSLLLALAGTLLSLISSSMISYVVAKFRFRGRNFIYLLAVLVMIVPSIGTVSATYKLINQMGLYNNVLGILLLYSGGFGFQFLLLYSSFKSLSETYMEAAYIDGASDFAIFTRVMLPMVFPTLVPLAILDFIGFWNDYFTPYLYLKDKPTLAVGLQSMVSQMTYNANWPALFALMLFSMLPIIVLFVCFQKQIMSNVTAGGIKG